MANGNRKRAHTIASVDKLTRFAVIGRDFTDWYPLATLEIVDICRRESWDVREFTNYLALLSPRCAVRRNIRVALTYQHHGQFFQDTIRSVRRSVEIYRETGEIRGKKTGPFADALLGDRSAIVLDTWMAKAFFHDGNAAKFQRIATRAACNSVVRQVGERLQICPRDAQACIWAGQFRELGGNPPFFPIAEEYTRWLAYDREFPLSGYIADEPPSGDYVPF